MRFARPSAATGEAEFTPDGQRAIERIFRALDLDGNGGLNFTELSRFFQTTEPDCDFTQEVYEGLGVETTKPFGFEVSPRGFSSLYRAFLESNDVEATNARLEEDLRLFVHTAAAEEEVIFIEEEKPVVAGAKRDAFALLQRAAKQGSSGEGVGGSARKRGSSNGAAKAKPSKPAKRVDTAEREEIDLVTPMAADRKEEEKSLHPFFTGAAQAARAKLEEGEKAGLSLSLPDFPPLHLRLLEARQPVCTTTTPCRTVNATRTIIAELDSNYSVLGKDVWNTSNARSTLNDSTRRASAETELFTERYKCERARDLFFSQRARLEAFLQTWLQTRSQQQQQEEESEEEESDLAWGNSNPELASQADSVRHILLLYGPTGCGKTFPVHLLAKEAGFKVLEVNASDDLLQLEKLHGEATQSYGLLHGSSKKLAMPLILLDEFDSEFESSADFGHAQTNAIKRFALRAKCPVILIASGEALPKLWSSDGVNVDLVKNFAVECVQCERPTLDQVVGLLRDVVKREHVPMDNAEQAIARLACLYKLDVRKCLNHLQFGLALPKEEEKSSCTVSMEPDGLCLPSPPHLDSLCKDGLLLRGTGLAASSVFVNARQVEVASSAPEGDWLQLVQSPEAKAQMMQEEEEELFEEPHSYSAYTKWEFDEVRAVNEYAVTRDGDARILRLCSNVLLTSACGQFLPSSQPPRLAAQALHLPIILPAAWRNIQLLQRHLVCHHHDEEEDEEEPAQARRIRTWFAYFLHDRAAYTLEIPFVIQMCRFEELNRTKLVSNRRGGRRHHTRHFKHDLDFVDTARTASEFSLPRSVVKEMGE